MKCGCGGNLKTTHSYDVPGKGGTGRARCTMCGVVFTVVRFLAREDPGHGEGAAAVARKIEDGSLTPRLEKET